MYTEFLLQALSLIGGLAFFLYGMNVMGDGLTRLSGGRLERILEKLTDNRIKAVLLGAGVTAVIQSSSATTVTVVGFVNSGIMKLNQAIGVIMGANIGTTVTSWILSLTGIEGNNLLVTLLKPTSFTPILAIIGIFLIMASKQEKRKDIGAIMIGFAILMFGMDTMSAAVKPLAVYACFNDVFQSDFRNVGRCNSYCDYSEFFRIGWYFTGTLSDRKCSLCDSNSDYHGTEYRYVCDGTFVIDRCRQKCEACRTCSFIF